MTDISLEQAIGHAKALEDAGQNQQALNVIRSCYHQVPLPQVATIYATTLCRMGERDNDGVDRLIKAHPTATKIRAARSEMALADGDYDTGFRLCKARWSVAKVGHMLDQIACPEWDGAEFDGDLLVLGEQGLGEEIMYASMMRHTGNRCILSADPRLHPLLSRSFPTEVIAHASTLPHFAHPGQRKICAMDLCAELGIRGNATPWLVADERKVKILRDSLVAAMPGKVIVGLSWFSTRERMGADKSIPAKDLLPLMADQRLGVINLQYGDIQADALMWKESGHPLNTIDGLDVTNDLDSLAALIMACDVVVTCSNTTAHLAGALGKRTLLLLPGSRFVLWFWGKEGDLTPWYPSIEILRGPPRKAWDELVMEAMGRI